MAGPAAARVVGMDSNTAESDSFCDVLREHGIASADPVLRTVAKRRSRLQTQVKKAGLLDVSLKDFVVAWSEDDGRKVLVRQSEQYPYLRGDSDRVEMLMPTAKWPFDHAIVVAEIAPWGSR